MKRTRKKTGVLQLLFFFPALEDSSLEKCTSKNAIKAAGKLVCESTFE
jgi:hypothetical protein